jgi:hypothetical protein
MEFYPAPAGFRVVYKNSDGSNRVCPLTGWMKQQWSPCSSGCYANSSDPNYDNVFGWTRVVPVDGSEGFWENVWEVDNFQRILGPGEEEKPKPRPRGNPDCRKCFGRGLLTKRAADSLALYSVPCECIT